MINYTNLDEEFSQLSLKPVTYAEKRGAGNGRRKQNKLKIIPRFVCAFSADPLLFFINDTIVQFNDLSELQPFLTTLQNLLKLNSKDAKYDYDVVVWCKDTNKLLEVLKSTLYVEEDSIKERYNKVAQFQIGRFTFWTLNSHLDLNILPDFTHNYGTTPEDDLRRVAATGQKLIEVYYNELGILPLSKTDVNTERLKCAITNRPLDKFIPQDVRRFCIKNSKHPSEKFTAFTTAVFGNPNKSYEKCLCNWKHFVPYINDVFEGRIEVPIQGVWYHGVQYFNFLKYFNKAGNFVYNPSLQDTDIENVTIRDIKSSYGFAMVAMPVPMSEQYEVLNKKGWDAALAKCQTRESIINNQECYAFTIEFHGVKRKNKACTIKYDKETMPAINPIVSNDQLLQADKITLCLLSPDYYCFTHMYDIESYKVITMFKSRAGLMPDTVRYTVLNSIDNKEKLSRQRQNGMPVEADYQLAKLESEMHWGKFVEKIYDHPGKSWRTNVIDSLPKRIGSVWWGLWTVAWGRFRHFIAYEDMIQIDPSIVPYGDTDQLCNLFNPKANAVYYKHNHWAEQRLLQVLPNYPDFVKEVRLGQWINEAWKDSKHYTKTYTRLRYYSKKRYIKEFQTSEGLEYKIVWSGVPRPIIKEVSKTIPDIFNNLHQLDNNPIVVQWRMLSTVKKL